MSEHVVIGECIKILHFKNSCNLKELFLSHRDLRLCHDQLAMAQVSKDLGDAQLGAGKLVLDRDSDSRIRGCVEMNSSR